MGYATRVKFDPVREISFGSIGATYVTVGTPFGDYVRILAFNNQMNQDLYISFDGATDHLRCARNSFKLYDLTANKVRDDGLFLPVGTQVYVKEAGTTPGSGDFWVEAMYGEGSK